MTANKPQSGAWRTPFGPVWPFSKGLVSEAGDPDVRRALYEAASAMLTRFKGYDSIRSWGLHLAKSKCHAKARVAVARKLAVVMHAMWRDGTVYAADPQTTDSERSVAVAIKERRIGMRGANDQHLTHPFCNGCVS